MPKISNYECYRHVFNCSKNLANPEIYISIIALPKKKVLQLYFYKLILIYKLKGDLTLLKSLTHDLHLRYLKRRSPLPWCLFFNFYKCGGHCQIVNMPLWSNCDRLFCNKPDFQVIFCLCSLATVCPFFHPVFLKQNISSEYDLLIDAFSLSKRDDVDYLRCCLILQHL